MRKIKRLIRDRKLIENLDFQQFYDLSYEEFQNNQSIYGFDFDKIVRMPTDDSEECI